MTNGVFVIGKDGTISPGPDIWLDIVFRVSPERVTDLADRSAGLRGSTVAGTFRTDTNHDIVPLRMLEGQKIMVVMPAYNAARTLERTLADINRQVVDDIVLIDDASADSTVDVAARLGVRTVVHDRNRGYGGNQKTCYLEALKTDANVVVMLHPDYQYTPRLIPAIASMVAVGEFDVVLGSRILSGGALKGGMPLHKYVSNRFLTAAENLVTGAKLSEYHTGYRAFSRAILEQLPLEENSDDFVFDAQMLAQCLYFGYRVGEVSCPTRYEGESSSINLRRSVIYGLGVLGVTAQFRLSKLGLARPAIFSRDGRRLKPPAKGRT